MSAPCLRQISMNGLELICSGSWTVVIGYLCLSINTSTKVTKLRQLWWPCSSMLLGLGWYVSQIILLWIFATRCRIPQRVVVTANEMVAFSAFTTSCKALATRCKISQRVAAIRYVLYIASHEGQCVGLLLQRVVGIGNTLRVVTLWQRVLTFSTTCCRNTLWSLWLAIDMTKITVHMVQEISFAFIWNPS